MHKTSTISSPKPLIASSKKASTVSPSQPQPQSATKIVHTITIYFLIYDVTNSFWSM